MTTVDPAFNGSIFRFDHPMIIATNRSSAVLLPVRLRYKSGGYPAGTVVALNTTDNVYDAYTSAGSSGTNVAAAVLFENHPVEDFPGTAATSTCLAKGIFGGCTLFKSKLTGYDATAKTALNARELTDATGVTTVLF